MKKLMLAALMISAMSCNTVSNSSAVTDKPGTEKWQIRYYENTNYKSTIKGTCVYVSRTGPVYDVFKAMVIIPKRGQPAYFVLGPRYQSDVYDGRNHIEYTPQHNRAFAADDMFQKISDEAAFEVRATKTFDEDFREARWYFDYDFRDESVAGRINGYEDETVDCEKYLM